MRISHWNIERNWTIIILCRWNPTFGISDFVQRYDIVVFYFHFEPKHFVLLWWQLQVWLNFLLLGVALILFWLFQFWCSRWKLLFMRGIIFSSNLSVPSSEIALSVHVLSNYSVLEWMFWWKVFFVLYLLFIFTRNVHLSCIHQFVALYAVLCSSVIGLLITTEPLHYYLFLAITVFMSWAIWWHHLVHDFMKNIGVWCDELHI